LEAGVALAGLIAEKMPEAEYKVRWLMASKKSGRVSGPSVSVPDVRREQLDGRKRSDS
jgi:hypothetical protein